MEWVVNIEDWLKRRKITIKFNDGASGERYSVHNFISGLFNQLCLKCFDSFETRMILKMFEIRDHEFDQKG